MLTAPLVADPAGDADVEPVIEVGGELRRVAREAVRDATGQSERYSRRICRKSSWASR